MIIRFKKFTVYLALLNVFCLNSYAQNDSTNRAGFEFLPLLSYDTDTGFGYGIKTFFYDQLNTKESFDVILFNSTKGEQWYKFVFSTPDFESRQGTKYPLAIDCGRQPNYILHIRELFQTDLEILHCVWFSKVCQVYRLQFQTHA